MRDQRTYFDHLAVELMDGVGRALGCTDDDPRIFETLADKRKLEELAAGDERLRTLYDGGRIGEAARSVALHKLLTVE